MSGARREPEVAAALGERCASFSRRSTSPRAGTDCLPGRRVCAHRPVAPCRRRRSCNNQAGAAAARVARRLERPIVADAHGRHSMKRCALRRASERRGSPAARARPSLGPGTSSTEILAIEVCPKPVDRRTKLQARGRRSRWSGRSLLSGAPTRRRLRQAEACPCESSTLGAIMLVRRRPGTAAFTDAGLRSISPACCSAGFRSPERRHPNRSRSTMKAKRRSRVSTTLMWVVEEAGGLQAASRERSRTRVAVSRVLHQRAGAERDLRETGRRSDPPARAPPARSPRAVQLRRRFRPRRPARGDRRAAARRRSARPR